MLDNIELFNKVTDLATLDAKNSSAGVSG